MPPKGNKKLGKSKRKMTRQSSPPKKRSRVVRTGRIGGATLQSVPTSMGVSLGKSTFGFAGPAQRLADQDSAGSLRIKGSDLYSITVTTAAGSQAAFNSSAIGPYYAYLSPSTISSRVTAIEEMFQWYAIRYVKVVYMPLVPTSQAGQLALGFSTDAQIQNAITTPTVQQIMEFNTAVLSPVWQISTMEIKHTGTRLYECYLSSESVDNRFQGIMAARTTGAAVGTTYGQLYMEYIIDFYQPVPLLSSTDRERRRALQWKHVGEPHELVHSRMVESKSTPTPIKLTGPAVPDLVGFIRVSADDDPVEDPPPPTFSPAPTRFPPPGAPGYVPVKVPSKK